MLCYAVLYYAMLCCIMLYYSMLRYVVLWYAILCHAMLCYVIYYTMLCCRKTYFPAGIYIRWVGNDVSPSDDNCKLWIQTLVIVKLGVGDNKRSNATRRQIQIQSCIPEVVDVDLNDRWVVLVGEVDETPIWSDDGNVGKKSWLRIEWNWQWKRVRSKGNESIAVDLLREILKKLYLFWLYYINYIRPVA